MHFTQAIRSVLPVWLALCVSALILGVALERMPGVLEGEQYYPATWTANLAHFDPHAYLLVAEQGYGAEGRGLQSSVRFPLFPFLTRAAIQITGWDGYTVMFWLTKAALLIGLIGVWLLVERWHDSEQADRAVLYVSFPLLGSGYTWLMSYPEALHLALWTAAFLLLLNQRCYLAGLIAALTMWSRPQAVALVPTFALMLLIEALREHGWRGLLTPALWTRGLLVCGLPALAYSAWLWRISAITEVPFSPFTSVFGYGRELIGAPWQPVIDLLATPFRFPDRVLTWEVQFALWQVTLTLVLLAVLIVLVARQRVPFAALAFTIFSLLPALSTGTTSIGRYALLTWIPIALIYVIPKRFDRAVIPVGVAFSMLTFFVLNLSRGMIP